MKSSFWVVSHTCQVLQSYGLQMVLCKALGSYGGFSATTIRGVGVDKCDVPTLTSQHCSLVISFGEMLCSFGKI